MTAQPTTRKFKQPRLGDLQRRVLETLLIHSCEYTDYNDHRYSGLEQYLLLQKLNNYATFQHQQWPVLVYTQSLLEKGRPQQAWQTLLRNLEVVSERVERECLAILESEERHIAEIKVAKKSPSDGNLGARFLGELPILREQSRERYVAARRYRVEVRALQRMSIDTDVDHAEMYDTVAALARNIWSLVSRFSALATLFRDTSLLPAGGERIAQKALAKAQSSLSRALRLLAEHGYIRRIEVQTAFDYPDFTYQIIEVTHEGRERYNELG